MGEWENGRMGEWEKGRMGEWENVGMGEWGNGSVVSEHPALSLLPFRERRRVYHAAIALAS